MALQEDKWNNPSYILSAKGIVKLIDEISTISTSTNSSALNAKDATFGAIGNGIADDTVALQNFLNACVSQKRPGIIPKGLYRITNTLWITDTAYEYVEIYGEGQGNIQSNGGSLSAPSINVSFGPVTAIWADFVDGPAIAIQYARLVKLSDMAIIGKNIATEALWNSNTTVFTSVRESYISSGVRDNRYSPYCGVAIDPCGGLKSTLTGTITFDGSSGAVVTSTNITGSFSNVQTLDPVTYTRTGGTDISGLTNGQTYFAIRDSATTIGLATTRANAVSNTRITLSVGTGTNHNLSYDHSYPRLSSYYGGGTGGSASVRLKNLSINQFVVGIMNQSHPSTTNSDNTIIDGCQISRCETGIAFGQSQARASLVIGCNVGQVRWGFNGLDYGAATAAPPLFVGNQIGYCYGLFKVPSSFGNLLIHDLDSESFATIGLFGIGAAGNRCVALIKGGRLQTTLAYLTNAGTGGRSAPMLVETHMPLTFENCTIGDNTGCDGHPVFNILGSGTVPVLFTGCHFNFSPATTGISSRNAYLGNAYDRGVGTGVAVSVRNCTYTLNGNFGNAYDDLGHTTIRFSSGRILCTPNQRFYEDPGYKAVTGDMLNAQFRVARYSDNNRVRAGSAAGSFTWDLTSNKTLTMSVTDTRYLLVGDYLYWRMLPFESNNPGVPSYGQSGLAQYAVALKILSINGVSTQNYNSYQTGANTVVCSLLWNPVNQYDQAYTTSGVDLPLCEWMTPPYAVSSITGTPLTFDITNSSNTITNISNTSILDVGDFFRTDSNDMPQGGQSIRLIARSGTTGNFTIQAYATVANVQAHCAKLIPLGYNQQKKYVTTTSATVDIFENPVVINSSGDTVLTLPPPHNNKNLEITLKNTVAFNVNASAALVVNATSANTPGNAVLTAVAGKWVTLKSDGKYWVTVGSGG